MAMPTGQAVVVALVAAICVVAVARFEVMCFKDLARRGDGELNYLSRTGWAVAIALIIPLGGVFYLHYGRRR